ncbi:Kinesin motor domain containing protein [Musa troglodytarum]|uniref:Kinesin motor domain containing protein n=1 Tax=Musa troglodytarum TaxID=320322 RepID=A0A9E7H892_9LILI|nr:Kinesin motor domain containing protein [Musa troglodytarum]
MKALANSRGGRVPSSETLTTPSSQKQRPPRAPKENVDPNTTPPESSPFKSPGKPLSGRNRSPLPPKPPLPSFHGGNPLKRKLSLETLAENGGPPSMSSDSGVQDDIFRLVGLPLVENCLAGFNSSIFAYGQTGSGKTYTMWGPPSALSEDSSSSEWGLTPRVFERLFSRINEEQAKHSDKQLNYQCHCSFLEASVLMLRSNHVLLGWLIYNEQITDLLDPTQKNLQIREDVKAGIYVDCLTEEYVYTMKDVIRLLTKGLANRRTGATSVNMESSRSHCVFTCIVDSQSKSIGDGLISLRTSRINLVDLAGSERQKQTGAAGERLKEAGNINRSLSQLGNLINILAEVSQSGKQRHIPYRDSRLTFLLQESLGGNAKLAMICAVSPSQGCKSETFSTLRFAQRAKAIKNKAVVNEITQDDVNVLREQIRQLKVDELLRMKSNGSAGNNGSFSSAWNARRSLNLLKMSLNCPTTLAILKDDSDVEMEIDESDAEMPYIQASQPLPCEGKLSVDLSASKEELRSSINDNDTVARDARSICKMDPGCAKDQTFAVEDCAVKKIGPGQLIVNSDGGSAGDRRDDQLNDTCEVHMADEGTNILPDHNTQGESNPSVEKEYIIHEAQTRTSSSSPNSLVSPNSSGIVPSQTSLVLQQPTLSKSPVLENFSRKSLRTSSSMSASQKIIEDDLKLGSGALSVSLAQSSYPLNTNATLTNKTENLAASLQRGLQIFDNQQLNSFVRRSSFRFSVALTDVKPVVPINKVDIGIQTIIQDPEEMEQLSTYVCSCCKKIASQDENEDTKNGTDLQLVPIDGTMSADKLKMKVPRAVKKVLTGSIRREMALEEQCAKQAAEIMQLNRLLRQYKHERECSAIIAETREDKISRLESLMDGILPTEEFMEEEFAALMNEHKLLKEKYENHPEIMWLNIELKRVQEELDGFKNFFNMGERDVLMEEIQDLRSQLQYYLDSSSNSSRKQSPLLQLTHSCGTTSTPLCTISESTEASGNEKIEPDGCNWTERESEWIILSEELKLELEASRSLAEKRKVELDSEKKCTEELKEALQTAMQGHARILEQYADLQEKHIGLLSRHRKIMDGIEDVKKAAARAGVKGAESKFINSLAAEISALRADREKERQYWRDENRGLQVQLRDTAEAVQAAGELLVRLKETEEAVATAAKRACMAEQETEKAYQEIDNLKKNYDREISLLNQLLAESRFPREARTYTVFNDAKTGGESLTDQRWREEFEPFCNRDDADFSKDTNPGSWFSGYDRCNI